MYSFHALLAKLAPAIPNDVKFLLGDCENRGAGFVAPAGHLPESIARKHAQVWRLPRTLLETGVVGEAGIEPATPDLEGPCSIQLSYSPCHLSLIRQLPDMRESGPALSRLHRIDCSGAAG